MRYKIRYNYDTGDSFHIERNISQELELTWSNYEVAQANLIRIKDHYDWFESKKSSFADKIDPSGKDWYNEKYSICINLYTDNGTKCEIRAPWCGYFENLNEIEIIIVGDKITFN